MINTSFKILIFWIIFLLFESCLLPKKLDKFFDKKPTLAAQKCNEKFPIKETTDTILVKDNTLIDQYEREFVYLYSLLDSLVGKSVPDSTKREIVTVFKEKQIPVYKYIVKTQESTAKLQIVKDSFILAIRDKDQIINDLQDEIKEHHDQYLKFTADYNALKNKSEEYRKQRNHNLLWVLILIIALFRKPLYLLVRRLLIKV